jgi:putative hydrolase of HD superfamily
MATPQDIFAKLSELSLLSFQYGETYRATTYPDGVTLESDTDHSFMLGVSACALQAVCAPELNRGRLAEFALIHDLVEVYAGDTPTLGTQYDKQEKIAREEAALERIKHEYDAVFPWIGETITIYEAQQEPEARFIKVLDKVMPGLTQIQNGGVIFEQLAIPAKDVIAGKDIQLAWVREVAKEWPLLVSLYEQTLEKVFALEYFQEEKE